MIILFNEIVIVIYKGNFKLILNNVLVIRGFIKLFILVKVEFNLFVKFCCLFVIFEK